MTVGRLVAVLAALVCAGCDLAPAYRAPKVDLPARFKEAGNVKIAEPSDHLPRGAWWTEFHDPTLDALEPQIDDENQTLAIAFANYQVARANVQQAEAGLFPTLSQYTQLTDNRQSEHRTYRTPDERPAQLLRQQRTAGAGELRGRPLGPRPRHDPAERRQRAGPGRDARERATEPARPARQRLCRAARHRSRPEAAQGHREGLPGGP